MCFSLKEEPKTRVIIAVQRLDLTESKCLNLVVLILCFQTQSLEVMKGSGISFSVFQMAKPTPNVHLFLLQTQNLHKSGEVRAMALIMFIVFKLSTVVWGKETLTFYGACMPKFHLRRRQ